MKPAIRSGLSVDDAHTPAEFAAWLQVSERWVREHLSSLPGVIRESERVVRIIPRRYAEARTAAENRNRSCR